MAVITISRGTMSGGKALAECVAKALDHPCAGREIVVQAAAGLGVSHEFLNEQIEQAPGFWERLTAQRAAYVLAVQTVLAQYAAKGALVYHGYAGHMLLRGLPCVLRVRLIAPLEMRVQAVVQQQGLSRGDAVNYIRRMDENRIRWTRSLYDVDLLDPGLYDLIINLEVISMDTACGMVVQAARSPQYAITPATLGKLQEFADRCRKQFNIEFQVPALPPAIRVLVVDDDKEFATVLATRLSKRGYPAQAVFSGTDALDRVRSRPFDVVILDLEMPPPDGLTTLKLLQHADPSLQVVVLSAHGTVERGIAGMQIGAADFLSKPADINKLCTALDAAAEITRERRATVQVALRPAG